MWTWRSNQQSWWEISGLTFSTTEESQDNMSFWLLVFWWKRSWLQRQWQHKVWFPNFPWYYDLIIITTEELPGFPPNQMGPRMDGWTIKSGSSSGTPISKRKILKLQATNRLRASSFLPSPLAISNNWTLVITTQLIHSTSFGSKH